MKWPQFLHWLTIVVIIAYIPTECNHNFVTYQYCRESNVTASENNGTKPSKPCRNGSHRPTQTPRRPNVRRVTRVAGGCRRCVWGGALHGRGRGWPRLPLAADWDGVLWLFFCVLVACGVGGYFVAFSLVADSVCELCVVIAGWRASSAVWDDLIEFAAEWVWCFECEVYGLAAQWADWYWSFCCDVSGFAFAAGCSILVSARTCRVAYGVSLLCRVEVA